MSILQGLNDLSTLLVTIDGVALPSGYADGDAVSVEYNAPLYNSVVGADGDLHRGATNDNGGTVTIRLKNTSVASRAILDGILRRHELGITAASTIVIVLRSTGERVVCAGSFPQDRPALSFATDPSDREYTFRCASITR
jgi:hypothetical protein